MEAIEQTERREEVQDIEPVHIDPETGEIQEPLSETAKSRVRRPEHSKLFNDTMVSTAGEEYHRAFFEVWKNLEGFLEGDAKGQHGMYSTLSGVIFHIKKLMIENDLMFTQYAGQISGTSSSANAIPVLPIITKIIHVPTGQFEVLAMPMPINSAKGIVTAHSLASAQTYGKRYSLMSYFGLATLDDDAAQSMRGKIEEAEAQDIADEIIETMKECETVPQLQQWGEMNSIGIKVLGERTAKKIYDAFKDLLSQLPQEVEEDKSQEPAKKSAKANKGAKKTQQDLEDAMGGRAA